jgi:hypothetical protein
MLKEAREILLRFALILNKPRRRKRRRGGEGASAR